MLKREEIRVRAIKRPEMVRRGDFVAVRVVNSVHLIEVESLKESAMYSIQAITEVWGRSGDWLLKTEIGVVKLLGNDQNVVICDLSSYIEDKNL